MTGEFVQRTKAKKAATRHDLIAYSLLKSKMDQINGSPVWHLDPRQPGALTMKDNAPIQFSVVAHGRRVAVRSWLG